MGDPTELHFSLFDVQNKIFLTDAYQVHLTKNGQPEDVNKIGHVNTIFREIYDREMSNIALVCRIVRIGRMLAEKGKGKQAIYRRPFACSVLRLSKEALGGGDQIVDHTLPVYSTPLETNFSQLHECTSSTIPFLLAFFFVLLLSSR